MNLRICDAAWRKLRTAVEKSILGVVLSAGGIGLILVADLIVPATVCIVLATVVAVLAWRDFSSEEVALLDVFWDEAVPREIEWRD